MLKQFCYMATWFRMQQAQELKLSAISLEAINSCICKTADWAELLPFALQPSKPKGTMMPVRHLKTAVEKYLTVEQIKAGC